MDVLDATRQLIRTGKNPQREKRDTAVTNNASNSDPMNDIDILMSLPLLPQMLDSEALLCGQ